MAEVISSSFRNFLRRKSYDRKLVLSVGAGGGVIFIGHLHQTKLAQKASFFIIYHFLMYIYSLNNLHIKNHLLTHIYIKVISDLYQKYGYKYSYSVNFDIITKMWLDKKYRVC